MLSSHDGKMKPPKHEELGWLHHPRGNRQNEVLARGVTKHLLTAAGGHRLGMKHDETIYSMPTYPMDLKLKSFEGGRVQDMQCAISKNYLA